MTRTQVINLIAKRFDCEKYLEIGCRRNTNFDRINVGNKVGVDPVRGGTIRTTSDEFFKGNKESYDLVFIDGLHHMDQVYRDMTNALAFLNPQGTVVVHDCNPVSYESQVVPQPRGLREWSGDVWRGFLRLRGERGDLEMFVVDADYGCGVIRSGKQDLIGKWDVPYAEFVKDKKALLNLLPVEEFIKWLER